MNTLSFAQDDSGAWGYKIGGADTVNPFKSGTPEFKTVYRDVSGSRVTAHSVTVEGNVTFAAIKSCQTYFWIAGTGGHGMNVGLSWSGNTITVSISKAWSSSQIEYLNSFTLIYLTE